MTRDDVRALIDERDDLEGRIYRLDKYAHTRECHELHAEQEDVINEQLRCMRGYLKALNYRLGMVLQLSHVMPDGALTSDAKK